MPRYLYHWTPAINVRSILRTGLDPSCATGARKVVWMGNLTRLMWAGAHAAKHQNCAPDEMVLLRVRVGRKRLGKTAWRGVFTSSKTIEPQRISVMRVALAPA